MFSVQCCPSLSNSFAHPDLNFKLPLSNFSFPERLHRDIFAFDKGLRITGLHVFNGEHIDREHSSTPGYSVALGRVSES